MFLLGQPVDVDLIGLRLEADVSAKGCANGKLGGAVTVEEFRSKVLPPIADGLIWRSNQIKPRQTPSCKPSTQTVMAKLPDRSLRTIPC